MNFLVLGKGKTGSLAAEIARERGHSVTALSSAENESAAALTSDKLRGVDAVIDFTTPIAAIENITACVSARANMVVGTTGWYAHLDKVRELVELSGPGFVYGSNFSVGVNVYFKVIQAAAAALPLGYEAKIMERHHAQKKDAPSGTAVTMQKLVMQSANAADLPEITSLREGDTVGMHVLVLDSENDSMMLVHDAKSRRGFAEGAVRAAEWISGKKGFYDFTEIFDQLAP